MFQSHAICASQTFNTSSRHTFFSLEPGVIGRRLLAVVAAGALVGAAAVVPHGTARSPAFTAPVIVQDSSVSALRDKAEAMRARLLGSPGVGAVTITGLRQQGLAVEYTPRRLARLGLTPASLAIAVPADQAQSRPGHLVLRTEAAGDVQGVADLPVRAGGRTLRLGDVAMVMRVPLAVPVSTMTIEGQPAAELGVVPVR